MPDTKSNRSEGPHSSLDDLRAQAGTVADDVKELGRAGADYARGRVEAAADRGRDARDSAVGRAHHIEDDIVEYVRDQPFKSLLIAAGVGAIAALWLRRS